MASLPLDVHPLYSLRKASILIGAVGIIFNVIVAPGPSGPSFIVCAVILILSCLFCAADIITYALKKAHDPDNEPEWPQRKWMLGDAVLAVVLQWVFWATISLLAFIWSPNVIGAYGALGSFLCSVIHAWAFWKQLLARKQNRWLASLPTQPCARCGYTSPNQHHDAPPSTRPSHQQHQQRQTQPPPNIFPYAGPSAPELAKSNIRTPSSATAESSALMEEGLLIGSDFGGYGSIPDPEPEPEPTVEQPEEVVVVAKGKKKKVKESVVGGF